MSQSQKEELFERLVNSTDRLVIFGLFLSGTDDPQLREPILRRQNLELRIAQDLVEQAGRLL